MRAVERTHTGGGPQGPPPVSFSRVSQRFVADSPADESAG